MDKSNEETGPYQCNAILNRISEHSLNKTMSYDEAKAHCETMEGTRFAKPMEILDFMAYVPDNAKSWTPVFDNTEETRGCRLAKTTIRRTLPYFTTTQQTGQVGEQTTRKKTSNEHFSANDQSN